MFTGTEDCFISFIVIGGYLHIFHFSLPLILGILNGLFQSEAILWLYYHSTFFAERLFQAFFSNFFSPTNYYRCATNCVGPPPCGGIGEWVTFHDTMEACCDAHLGWKKTYVGCSTLPEGTESPTQKPTPSPIAPTKNPTTKPTKQVRRYLEHMLSSIDQKRGIRFVWLSP